MEYRLTALAEYAQETGRIATGIRGSPVAALVKRLADAALAEKDHQIADLLELLGRQDEKIDKLRRRLEDGDGTGRPGQGQDQDGDRQPGDP